MFNLKIGNKEYQIKFAIEPTLKSKILSKMVKSESVNQTEDIAVEVMESIEESLLRVPELLLVGLQKFHSDEFGYNYTTEEDKEDKLAKAFGLVEQYLDDDESHDITELNELLNKELMENSFLKKMFQKMLEEQKKMEEEMKKASAKKTSKK